MIRIFNSLLRLSNLRSFLAFKRDADKADKVQREYLLSLIDENRDTNFGREFGFNEINTIADFQSRVPISDYDDHEDYIRMHMEGTGIGVTTDQIALFELSSGSTAASKYIPYTKGLQSDYMAGVKPWLYNLYTSYPELMMGKSYWSISPISKDTKYTDSGIPIGFQDDTGYFDFFQRYLFSKLFVIPKDIKQISDMEDFRYITMLFLLKEKSLTLISVWNPTFLEKLLDVYDRNRNQILMDIDDSSITPPNGSSVPDSLKTAFKVSRRRARLIVESSKLSSRAKFFKRIWPNLRIISCWDQGNAKPYARRLYHCFEDITIQGKGLLATEGIISIPIEGHGHPISYKSHFFEFVDVMDDSIHLLHQLKEGNSYDVLITTRGGLYRYKLKDIVKVTGFYLGLPCLEFMGKSGNISDFFGEKINETHVRDIFNRVSLNHDFAFMAPCDLDGGFRYVLFIDEGHSNRAEKLVDQVESELRENFHYRYARELGQLKGVRAFIMRGDYERQYYDFIAEHRGMKLGDIKFQMLMNFVGFNEIIDGEIIGREI